MDLAGCASVLAIVGSFSIDSVVAPDGRALPGKTGGNAVWSAVGAVLAGGAPRVLSRVGQDYPEEVLQQLGHAGVDLTSVRRIEGAHPVRVTFAYLPGGGRSQPVPAHLLAAMTPAVRAQFVDHTHSPRILSLGAPAGEDVPTGWLEEVDAWHLPLLPLRAHRSVVAALAGRRGLLHSDSPARTELAGDAIARLRPTLPAIDVFLPSTSDLDVFAARTEPFVTVDRMVAAGAGPVVLKAGAEGAYLFDGDEIWHVPAHAGPVLDPTGAGDAFCGAFLHARAGGLDLLAAVALGAAAASFAVAVADPLELLSGDPEQTHVRARTLLRAARRIDEPTLFLTRVAQPEEKYS